MATTFYTLAEASQKIGVSVGSIKRAVWRGVLSDAVKVSGPTGGQRWQIPAKTVSKLEQMGPKNALGALLNGVPTTKATGRNGATTTAKKPKVPVATKNQHIILVMDESSSMGPHGYGLVQAAERYASETLNTMTKEMKAAGFDVQVSASTFSGDLRRKFRRQSVANLMRLDTNKCTGTSIHGAIAGSLQDAMGSERPNESTLLLIVTDGEHNAGTSNNPKSIIQRAIATDRYTIAIAGPESVRAYARMVGIPDGCVTVWGQTVKGVEQLGAETQVATRSYTAARSAGKTSTKSFFTTDLSGVSEKDLKKLTDLSDHFRELKVDKEVRVDEFIESKTKAPIVLGSAYYTLMKPETVQASKGVLIRKKGTKRILGGQQARRLLGLPNVDTKVTPGNHSDYDVFIQSTSVNRKLPRGTVVLWDKTHTTGLKPTWDHTAL